MVAAGWLLLRKGAKNGLILSRTLIVALLITALAGPYYPITTTELDVTPSITVLSDETRSMDIFEKGAGQEIYDMLLQQTPARMVSMRGLRSDIGDEIVASSIGGDHIIVVSDGNNNFGKELGESIDFVAGTGTSVYAVIQQPKDNDLSVQITGARTAVLGNENSFGIEIRQAGGQTDYTLNVMVDGELETSKTISQTSVMYTDPFSNKFYSLGPHVVTAEITSKDDLCPDNNVFNKTIYVVPKPRILLVTLDTESPLLQILKSLYDLDIASTPDGINLSDYKVVVMDNLNEGRISAAAVDNLRDYAASGGGLVVVGGDNSYNNGNYLQSNFETILPVDSYPSKYKGSVNVVIVMDLSGSVTSSYDVGVGFADNKIITKKETILQFEKAIALDLLEKYMNRDFNVGIVAFGKQSGTLTDGMIPRSNEANRKLLVDIITNLKGGFGSDYTSYDEGLNIADKLIENEIGEKNVIIISDGYFTEDKNGIKDTYDSTRSIATTMVNKGYNVFFCQILTDQPPDEFKSLVLEIYGNTDNYYIPIIKGDEINLKFGPETSEIPQDEFENFTLVMLDEEHFITRYLNITGSISGYNDVTQKVGASRLVTTSMGKPVVTSWQFGLGRVVALNTDNGNLWAGSLYYDNPQLLPSMINWAVGDPRPDDGIVVFSSDLSLGSPGTITIRSDEMPDVTFNGQDVPVIQTEERTFEGVIEPEEMGVLPLRVSIDEVTLEDIAAVNYPLEYRDVGNNPDFLEAVKRNSGGVYTIEQVRSMLFNDIRENSVITSVEHGSLGWIPLLVALLIFLVEVIIRTAKGIVKIKMKRKGVIQ